MPSSTSTKSVHKTKLDKTDIVLAGVHLISKFLFWYVLPILRLGRRRDLEVEDMPKLEKANKTQILGEKLGAIWTEEQLRNKSPKLRRSLVRLFGKESIYVIMLCLLFNTMRVCQALTIGYLVRYYDGDLDKQAGILAAVALLISTVLVSVLLHRFTFRAQVLGMRMRVALSHLIYKKVLRLSHQSLVSSNKMGDVSNFLSNDLNRLDRYATFLPYGPVAPIQLIIVGAVLYDKVGSFSLLSIAVFALLAPVQGTFGRLFATIRRKVAIRTDTRVRLIKEVVAGISLIKICTWETIFAGFVATARTLELGQIRRRGWLDSIDRTILESSTRFSLLLTLVALTSASQSLTASTIFTMLALLNVVRLPVTTMLPMAIMGASELLVSLQRIQKYLESEDVVVYDYDEAEGSADDALPGSIEFIGFSASWSQSCDLVVDSIDLRLEPGQLVGLCGSVGSGKSSLLQGILKELQASSGSVQTVGRIVYSSQIPTIFPGTVRENILFGSPMNEERYAEVLDACVLLRDLKTFQHGDQTLLGDKGLSLSGGQKARLNLARAVYHDGDIVLLDDPLSAVDVNVGRQIFAKCIKGILRGKTVVLATHQTQYLKSVDKVIVLENGRILESGTFDQLRLSAIGNKELTDSDSSEHLTVRTIDDIFAEDEDQELTFQSNGSNSGGYGTFLPGNRVSIEERSRGVVRWATWKQYFRTGSPVVVVLIFIILIFVSQVVVSGSDYWLQFGSGNEYSVHHLTSAFFLTIYGTLIAISAIVCLLKYLLLYVTSLDSAEALHRNVLGAVIRAPLAFFQENSQGRVLNRLVNDVGAMDENCPSLLATTVSMVSSVVGSIVLVTIESPVSALPALLFLVFIYLTRRFYIRPGANLKRLESVSRSPLFGHVNTSMLGITSIRAFAAQRRFESQFCSIQDRHSACFYTTLAAARWFGLVVDSIFSVYMALVVVSLFIIDIGGPAVALAVTSAVSMTGLIGLAVSQASDMEIQFVAVERLLEYTKISPEAPLQIPRHKPPPDWPRRGNIQMDDILVKYGRSQPALSDVSIFIRPGEKIGVVGRTGAGKTTLISTLFRLVEPTSGRLHLDGLDVLRMGLHDLRSKMTLVPQDPVLFAGTVRKNLDPIGKHPDELLQAALQEVEMTGRLAQHGLETLVADSGGNFSVGEKQLICMARAILNKHKILVLDEATAHLDNETDALIQKIIREKFVESTVITIAHRLDTVMDSDRICLIDRGRVVEFDEPYKLLQRENGRLFRLVDKSGEAARANLYRIAKLAFEKRRL